MTGWKQGLGLAALLLLCVGFEWPGRAARLAQQLRSEDVDVRREAARLLGEHSADDAREALLVALDDADASVRQTAIASAAKVGMREHVPVLIDWLNDPAVETRLAAAEALGVLREARAGQALIRVLGDNDAHVRAVATRALGQIGGADSVTPLLGRLDDPDPTVRLAAVAALGAIRDPRALVPLMSRTQDPAIEVKTLAIGVIGAMNDPRALSPLLRSLNDDAEEARLAAIAALGRLEQAAAVEPLRALLAQADGRTGRAVLSALAAIGTTPAVTLIADQLGKPELSRTAIDVLVERVRRVRRLEPDAATVIVNLLSDALKKDADGARVTALEDALVGCARYVSIAGATPTLLALLERSNLPMTALALASTHDEQALLPLLQRLEGAAADDKLALLRALDVLMAKLPPDGRAADPLLAALDQAQPEAVVLIARLLGRTGAPRALPALTELLKHARIDNQLAAIEAVGAVGGSEASATLLSLLADKRARIREATIKALGETLDATQALAELDRAVTLTDVERFALLRAVNAAIDKRARAGLPADQQGALVAKLAPLVIDEDETVAALAIDSLGLLGTAQASDVIATQLRSPEIARRAQAARALGGFDDARVRQVLRYVIGRDHVDVTVAAAIALSRFGEAEDALSLIKQARRQHWPFPAAASYAVTVFARRGLLRPLASHGLLCALGRSREPIVRANVAVAMAQLGVGACENGPDPIAWLEPNHAPLVRAAAARWTYAAMNAGHIDRTVAMTGLRACAARDVDPQVAEACAAPDMPALDARIVHVVTDSEGRAPLRKRLLALVLGDASVFVGHTDDNGTLRIALAPGPQVVVTDPGLLPLEAPLSPAPTASAASPAVVPSVPPP